MDVYWLLDCVCGGVEVCVWVVCWCGVGGGVFVCLFLCVFVCFA